MTSCECRCRRSIPGVRWCGRVAVDGSLRFGLRALCDGGRSGWLEGEVNLRVRPVCDTTEGPVYGGGVNSRPEAGVTAERDRVVAKGR
jgi:hypothetical protein